MPKPTDRWNAPECIGRPISPHPGGLASSAHSNRLRPVDRVSCKKEISDQNDAAVFPIQKNKGRRLTPRVVQIEHENRWPAVDESQDKPPVVAQRISVKIFANPSSTASLSPIDQIKPDIFREHVAYRIEITRVKALYIGREPRAFRLCQNGRRDIVWLSRQLAQADTATLQGGFRRRDAAPGNLTNLLELIAEDVFQDNRAALSYRQAHKDPQAGGGDLSVTHSVYRSWDHVQILIGMRNLLTPPSSKEIQCCVMSDPKQPSFRVCRRLNPGRSLDRFQKCLLNHVLAVNH